MAEFTNVRNENVAVPGGIFVAMMSGSKIRIYRGCFGEADKIKEMDIEVKPGQVLLFRGDVAHCGLPYDHTNL